MSNEDDSIDFPPARRRAKNSKKQGSKSGNPPRTSGWRPPLWTVVLTVVGFSLSFVGWMLKNGSLPGAPATESMVRYFAYTTAKKGIPEVLKRPTTASFPRETVHVESKAPMVLQFPPRDGKPPVTMRQWEVKGSVDAQNSFAAMIRSPWEVTVVEPTPGELVVWKMYLNVDSIYKCDTAYTVEHSRLEFCDRESKRKEKFSQEYGFGNLNLPANEAAAVAFLDQQPDVEWWVAPYPFRIGVNEKCDRESAVKLARKVAHDLGELKPKDEEYASATVQVELTPSPPEYGERKLAEVHYSRDRNEYRTTIFDEQGLSKDAIREVADVNRVDPKAGGREAAQPAASARQLIAVLKRYSDKSNVKESEQNELREAWQSLVAMKQAAVPELVIALKDVSWPSRAMATNILRDIGPEARDAVDALVAIAKSPDTYHRVRALAALAKISPDPYPCPEALVNTLRSRDVEARAYAAEILNELAAQRAVFIPRLSDHLEDEPYDVRHAVVLTVHNLGGELSSMMKFVLPDLRPAGAADENRQGLENKIEAAFTECRRCQEQIDELQEKIDSAKGKTAKIKEVVTLRNQMAELRKTAARHRQDVERWRTEWAEAGKAADGRRSAAMVVAAIGPPAKDAEPALAAIIKYDPIRPVRLAAENALQQLHPEALKKLREETGEQGESQPVR